MDTVNLIHLKTIYKGCPENGQHALPNKSHVVRFCYHTSHSHATMMSLLSPAFLDAQQQYDEKVSDEPFHITILWPHHLHMKRKEENKETAYEAMLYFVENMMAPKNGAIISIYRTPSARPWQTTQWRHSQIWPFEKQWDPQGEYVTVHKAEPLMSRNRIDKVTMNQNLILPKIEKLATKYGYQIKYIDYTLTTKEIVDTITKSDYHFCYSGATYYTAAMVGIPALAWHHWDEIYTDELDVRNIDNVVETHEVQRATWGAMSSHNGKIRQYDFERECVNTFPNQNQRHIEHHWELEKAFIRMIK